MWWNVDPSVTGGGDESSVVAITKPGSFNGVAGAGAAAASAAGAASADSSAGAGVASVGRKLSRNDVIHNLWNEKHFSLAQRHSLASR
jgi:hypothetical protein